MGIVCLSVLTNGLFELFSPSVGIRIWWCRNILFLSGVGIALSLSKSPTFMNFVFRRVSRILPAYWIILTFFYLLINGSFRDYFGEFLTLSYWYPLIIGTTGGVM